MIVVSDTTPLSELAKVGQMGLLAAIFGVVLIPQQVYDECDSLIVCRAPQN